MTTQAQPSTDIDEAQAIYEAVAAEFSRRGLLTE